MRNHSRPMRRLLYFCVGILLAAWMSPAAHGATPAITTVSGTLYRADGTPAQGSASIYWNAFTTADGTTVSAGTVTLALDVSGNLTAQLVPNTGSTPSGSYYRVVLRLDDGTTSEEMWVVPNVAQITISAVRASVVPATAAKQFLGRDDLVTALATVVPASTTVNGHPLSGNVTITPGDVGNTTAQWNANLINGSAPATVATSGSYNDLTNKPTLGTAAAHAATDFQSPISLTTNGSSGAATFSNNVLNVPQYPGGSVSTSTAYTWTALQTFNAGINFTSGAGIADWVDKTSGCAGWRGSIYVLDCGADKTNTNDSSTAVTTALTNSTSSWASPGLVEFPAGTYKVSNIIMPSDSFIQGKQMAFSAPYGVSSLRSNSSSPALTHQVGASALTIRKMDVSLQNAGTTFGLYSDGSRDLTIEDSGFRSIPSGTAACNTYGDGGGTYNPVSSNYQSTCPTAGIHGGGLEHFHVRHSYFSGNGYCIDLQRNYSSISGPYYAADNGSTLEQSGLTCSNGTRMGSGFQTIWGNDIEGALNNGIAALDGTDPNGYGANHLYYGNYFELTEANGALGTAGVRDTGFPTLVSNWLRAGLTYSQPSVTGTIGGAVSPGTNTVTPAFTSGSISSLVLTGTTGYPLRLSGSGEFTEVVMPTVNVGAGTVTFTARFSHASTDALSVMSLDPLSSCYDGSGASISQLLGNSSSSCGTAAKFNYAGGNIGMDFYMPGFTDLTATVASDLTPPTMAVSHTVNTNSHGAFVAPISGVYIWNRALKLTMANVSATWDTKLNLAQANSFSLAYGQAVTLAAPLNGSPGESFKIVSTDGYGTLPNSIFHNCSGSDLTLSQNAWTSYEIDASGVIRQSGCFSGGGTVTTFSIASGYLNPLWSCSVSNPSTTPELSCTAATNITPNYVLAGPSSGSAGGWSFRALVAADIPSSLGATSFTGNVGLDGTHYLQLNGSILYGASSVNPATTGGMGAGSLGIAGTAPWANIYMAPTGGTNYVRIYVPSMTANRTLTIPDANTNTVQPLTNATSHKWVQYIDSTGTQNLAQPGVADVTGAAPSASPTFSGTVTLPSSYVVGGNTITQPSAAGTLALTSQIPSVPISAIQNNGTGVTPSSGAINLVPGTNVTLTTSGNSVTIAASGGGGSPAFSSITSGTNTSATMTVGSGASITTSGTGTIAATSATNLAGGGAGSMPYQSAANTTAFVSGNTANNDCALTSTGNGTSNTGTSCKNAPALSTANMTFAPLSWWTSAPSATSASSNSTSGKCLVQSFLTPPQGVQFKRVAVIINTADSNTSDHYSWGIQDSSGNILCSPAAAYSNAGAAGTVLEYTCQQNSGATVTLSGSTWYGFYFASDSAVTLKLYSVQSNGSSGGYMGIYQSYGVSCSQSGGLVSGGLPSFSVGTPVGEWLVGFTLRN